MSEPAPRLRRLTDASARPQRRGRVLIVDDSWDAREMYALYFRNHGYDAMTASDGDAGIGSAIKSRPDVIVMDLAMPKVSGISAAHQLRNDSRTRKIPIILLTGHGHRAIDDGLFKMGIDVVLTKPCLPEDLEGHVRRLLEEHHST
jgi:two-component system cell cycle response regulator DivK